MGEARYIAAPCTNRANSSWLVYDEPTGRLVAIPLRRQNAYTLARTLNIAMLAEAPRDYGDESRVPSLRRRD